MGIIAVGAYVALTVLICGKLGEAEGRYALHLFDPALWARNAAMLFGVSATTVDTIALFGHPRNVALVAFSLVGGLIILIPVLQGLVRSKQSRGWLLYGLVILVLAGPHLFLGHVSEMYAYPVVAAFALLVAIALTDLLRTSSASTAGTARKLTALAVGLFILTSVCVDSHKWYAMYQTGLGAQAVGRAIDAQTLGPKPDNVCVVKLGEGTMPQYSVFQAPPGAASFWGMAVLPLWGWTRPGIAYADNLYEASLTPCDAIWIIHENGDVVVKAINSPRIETPALTGKP